MDIDIVTVRPIRVSRFACSAVIFVTSSSV